MTIIIQTKVVKAVHRLGALNKYYKREKYTLFFLSTPLHTEPFFLHVNSFSPSAPHVLYNKTNAKDKTKMKT